MNTFSRSVAFAGALVLGLSAAAGAATVRLVPLASAQTVGATVSGCATPSSAATVAAAPVDYPAIAAAQHVSGIAQVRIAIDPRGALTATSLMTSSGNRWLDRAALRAARLSRYSAEVRNCAPVGGEYAFVVEFAD